MLPLILAFGSALGVQRGIEEAVVPPPVTKPQKEDWVLYYSNHKFRKVKMIRIVSKPATGVPRLEMVDYDGMVWVGEKVITVVPGVQIVSKPATGDLRLEMVDSPGIQGVGEKVITVVPGVQWVVRDATEFH
jgi:hypothetical protein